MQSSIIIFVACLTAAIAKPVDLLDPFLVGSATGDSLAVGGSVTTPGESNSINVVPPIQALTGSGNSIGNIALGDWGYKTPSFDFDNEDKTPTNYVNGITPEPETLSADDANTILFPGSFPGSDSSTDILAQTDPNISHPSRVSVDWHSNRAFEIGTVQGTDQNYHLEYPNRDGGTRTYLCNPEDLVYCHQSYESLEKIADKVYVIHLDNRYVTLDNLNCKKGMFLTSH